MNIQTDIREYEYEYEYSSHTKFYWWKPPSFPPSRCARCPIQRTGTNGPGKISDQKFYPREIITGPIDRFLQFVR